MNFLQENESPLYQLFRNFYPKRMKLLPPETGDHRLWQLLLTINSYLYGPTIVCHNGSQYLDLVMKSLSVSFNRTLVVAQTPERPYNIRAHTPKNAVLIGDDPDVIVPSLREWPLWNGHGRIVVIVEKEEFAHKWLRSLWRWTRAVNVAVVVIPTLKESFKFYTWFPYVATDCSNVTTITEISLLDLFPKKINPPFHNCPLTAVTTLLAPIVVDDFRGMEPRIFHTLAEKLQMNASYSRLPEGEYVWMLFVGGKPAQGMKRIFDNEVDLMFSMLSSWIVLPYADYLMPHGRDSSYWWVPAERPAPRATAIYRAFSFPAWTAVITVCLFLFLTLSLMSSLEKKSPSFAFLNTVAVALNLPSKAPSSNKWNLSFVIIAYVYSLHITTGYQSSLIIFLSDVPRLKSIDTIEELANSDLIIEFHEGHRGVMSAMSDSPVYAALNDPKRSVYGPINHLELIADPGRHAMLGAGYPFKLQREMSNGFHDQFGYPLVKHLPEPFTTRDLRFCICRGHPLHFLLDKYVQMLVEGGFPDFFVNENFRMRPKPLRHLQPFSIENVQGPFLLLTVLLAISFAVWVCELIVNLLERYLRRTWAGTSNKRRPYRLTIMHRFSQPTY